MQKSEPTRKELKISTVTSFTDQVFDRLVDFALGRLSSEDASKVETDRSYARTAFRILSSDAQLVQSYFLREARQSVPESALAPLFDKQGGKLPLFDVSEALPVKEGAFMVRPEVGRQRENKPDLYIKESKLKRGAASPRERGSLHQRFRSS